MVRIQIHEVISGVWEKNEKADEFSPKTLIIQTPNGEHRISLFPLRPSKPADKPGEDNLVA